MQPNATPQQKRRFSPTQFNISTPHKPNEPKRSQTMKGRPMESILSLYLDRPNPQDYPASYPKLWVDNKTGDIKMAESSDQGDSVDYRVELDVYNGPLDLLLYLLKRDELDIYDIPISLITETYMGYVRMLNELSSEQGLDI